MKKSKELRDFLMAIGFRESSLDYENDQNSHYWGMYQMGKLALAEAGYYDTSKDKFTGKNGVYSKKDFLKNPIAQEDAIRLYERAQWKQIKSNQLDKYLGKTINGIKITESGMVASSHLLGSNGLQSYLNSNGKNIPKDGNGTSIEEYMKKFGGYDVSELTKKNYSIPFQKLEPLDKYFDETYKNTFKTKNSKQMYEELANNSKEDFQDVLKNAKKGEIDYWSERFDGTQKTKNKFGIKEIIEKLDEGGEKLWDELQDELEQRKKPKKLTGAMLKEMKVSQRQRLQDFADRMFSTKVEAKEFDGKFSRDYVNEVSGDSKIFTMEDLESMSEDELRTKKKAIDFQKEKMGIPTKKEAQKEVLKGGMIHVKSYVRSDGTKVRDYYRTI